jgi:Rad3-related DNA helicase
LIVLGDPRLHTRGYGRVFLRSLPPMPVIGDPAEAIDFATTLAGVPVADAPFDAVVGVQP